MQPPPEELTPERLKAALQDTFAKFLPYQLRYIKDRSRKIVCEKAVRIGITYAHSWKMAYKRVYRDPRAKRNNEYFASKNLKTAAEYLGYHRKWAEFFNKLHGEGFIDLSKWTTEKAAYPGGDIIIVSSDPDATRGVEGDQTGDEFAYAEQQARQYAAMQSRIQWLEDGQIHLISSHSHPETVFMRIADSARRGNKEWSLHRTTLPEAVAQGLALKVPGSHQDLLVAA